MAKQIYVNLPVKDLDKSVEFFRNLDFEFDPQFTDDKAACLIIGENIYAMLLREKFFKTFTKKEISDAAKSTEVIIAFSVDSREDVDGMIKKAIESGGESSSEPQENDWMYARGFQDVDGHLWEVMYADAEALKQMQNELSGDEI